MLWYNINAKLKLEMQNGTEVTLNISSNVVGNYNDESNFSHKLFLTNTQVPRLCKTFTNNSSVTKKLSNTQLSKIRQSEGLIWRFLRWLLKIYLLLMINALKPLAKSDLILLRLTAAASARDATIQKRILGFCMTTLINSNKEIGGIMKIVKSLKESSFLIKRVGEIIKNKGKEQKVEFLACY